MPTSSSSFVRVLVARVRSVWCNFPDNINIVIYMRWRSGLSVLSSVNLALNYSEVFLFLS